MEYNSKEALFDYMDGAAELYLAYGFQSLTGSEKFKSRINPYHP